jgi:hypothetical protein
MAGIQNIQQSLMQAGQFVQVIEEPSGLSKQAVLKQIV